MNMRIDIITLFPEFFESFVQHSIVGRAVKNNKLEIVTHNLRDYADDKYKSVDDHPYGGGPGMVLRFDVLLKALTAVKTILKPALPAGRSQMTNSQIKTILLTPQGEVYNQRTACRLRQVDNLILICGHYEGFDERIREYCDLEISVGDYVLTGGEVPAMVIVDSVVRLLPGVLGDDQSSHDESHTDCLLEYPQYTRPEEYEGEKVPEILMNGNHAAIDKWRREQAIDRTKTKRPDLIKNRRT